MTWCRYSSADDGGTERSKFLGILPTGKPGLSSLSSDPESFESLAMLLLLLLTHLDTEKNNQKVYYIGQL